MKKKGKKAKEKIIVFDTTLRDGEQAPGASLTSEQKLEIAYQLEKLGVDVIEAGFPIASPDDFKAVDLISRKIKKSSICGLARCLTKDIEAASESLKRAKHSRIHIFLATSKIHLKYKFKKAEDEILNLAKKATKFARNLCPDVEFSPEDATRSQKDFLYRVVETVIKEGARTINIPDTVGYSYPQEVHSLITDIRNNVPNINKATIAIHCHDDLGMAVANSLSAVLAGARQVHCTINGIGERAGNASLEEIVMALNTRKDAFKNLKMGIETKEIARTSRLVSSLTGFIIPPNKAIVGKNAFAHESGIHQDAILKKRSTYEIMNPKDVGIDKSQIVLGKHSGRHALAKRLEKVGFKFSKERIAIIFKQFKVLADKKKEIFDDDLIALAEEQTKPKVKIYDLISTKAITETGVEPYAEVKIKHKGRIRKAESTGDGPVDACYKAIDKITGVKTKLLNYKLDAITIGKDAQGRVKVEIIAKGKIVSGRGSSTDILESSVKAYLDALNRVG
ncbi:MAG: 2-isopropylmalate synthase [Candidatus Omnitrophica bacterium]|nr:2-isopropylmalate synthase [Candidatus Omnitrophota bacterium]